MSSKALAMLEFRTNRLNTHLVIVILDSLFCKGTVPITPFPLVE